MFCNTCAKNPCQCVKASAACWLIQQCSETGCPVTIRVRAGRQEPYPLCKWHRDGTAYIDVYQREVPA